MAEVTREDVEILKENWAADPIWDLEGTEGFEEYQEELKAFSDTKKAEWKSSHDQQEQKQIAHIQKKADRLGCSFGVASTSPAWRTTSGSFKIRSTFFWNTRTAHTARSGGTETTISAVTPASRSKGRGVFSSSEPNSIYPGYRLALFWLHKQSHH